MDKIKIENLEVFAKHGVFPEENKLGQKLISQFPPEFDDYISIRLFKNANMSQRILQKVQR